MGWLGRSSVPESYYKVILVTNTNMTGNKDHNSTQIRSVEAIKP